jgi:MFS family permease
MGEDASEQAGLPFRTSFFYGWVIVAISALTMFFSGPGQTYSVSTFIDSYISEFGWSRSIVSGMYSAGTLTAGLAMGAVGNVFDRRGYRLVTAVVAVLLGFACIWMSLVSSVPMLFVGFLLIRLLGQGSLSLSSSTMIPQWFILKKGRALSYASLGSVLSSAVLPPLNTWIIQTYGWKMGWHFWAVLLVLVMAPVSYLLIRNKPEDVGLLPDNLQLSTSSRSSGEAFLDEVSWTLGEAIRTRCFWLLLFCRMVPSAITTGLVFHQVSVMAQVGLPLEAAAVVLCAMAIVRLPVTLVAGQIADRVPTKYLIALSQGGLVVSMVILLFANSMVEALVYGVLAGAISALQGISDGVIWPEYYGRGSLSSISGVTMMAGVIGSALGPLPYGFAYDIFGNYSQVIIASMLFPLLGLFAALLANRPMKKEN